MWKWGDTEERHSFLSVSYFFARSLGTSWAHRALSAEAGLLCNENQINPKREPMPSGICKRCGKSLLLVVLKTCLLFLGNSPWVPGYVPRTATTMLPAGIFLRVRPIPPADFPELPTTTTCMCSFSCQFESPWMENTRQPYYFKTNQITQPLDTESIVLNLSTILYLMSGFSTTGFNSLQAYMVSVLLSLKPGRKNSFSISSSS